MEARAKSAAATAAAANAFVEHAREALRDEPAANMVLLRGWSSAPDLPSFGGAYALTPAAIAA